MKYISANDGHQFDYEKVQSASLGLFINNANFWTYL